MTKEQTREEKLTSYVVDAIAYMHHQPATPEVLTHRRQLQEVAQYLHKIDQSSQLVGCNHD